MDTSVMERLARRGPMTKKFGMEYVDGSWPYLKIKNPVGVARVIGEAKRGADKPERVFVRGQSSHYNSMRPSLFRSVTSDIDSLRAAEQEFCRKVFKRIPIGRFQVNSIGSLLQHYGFRTSWLDVVDNLFVAYWFAGHQLLRESDQSVSIQTVSDAWGWLYILSPPPDIVVVDMRATHHPLSARPHVQHGVSVACPLENDPDLRRWVVATVYTKVSSHVSGRLFSSAGLFPDVWADHTLKLLLKHNINDLARSVEKSYRLEVGALGRVLQVNGST